MNHLLLLPFPPPFAGPEMIAKEIVNSDFINNRDDVIILDSNIQLSNKNKGKINAGSIIRFMVVYCKFLYYLFRVKTVFFYLNSNKTGFLRDSFYILSCGIFGKKCIGQHHGSHFDHFYENQNKFSRYYIKRVLSNIDMILVFSKDLKKIFNKFYKRKVEVLYNGLDLNKYKYNKVNKTENNQFTILYMAHLTYSKGFYDLIYAYKMLFEKYGKNVSLIFAGENYEDDPRMDLLSEKWKAEFFINGRTKENICSDFIENCNKYNSYYAGVVSGNDKRKLFLKSDIFVLPSYSEGLSMSCLEAMAFGLPVITTPVGAMPNVIKNGKNGFLTPIANHEKLFENIELLMNNKDLRIKMGNNNIQAIKDKYDIEKIVKKLFFFLDNV